MARNISLVLSLVLLNGCAMSQLRKPGEEGMFAPAVAVEIINNTGSPVKVMIAGGDDAVLLPGERVVAEEALDSRELAIAVIGERGVTARKYCPSYYSSGRKEVWAVSRDEFSTKPQDLGSCGYANSYAWGWWGPQIPASWMPHPPGWGWGGGSGVSVIIRGH